MGDLRDGRATAPESLGQSFLEEASLFHQGPEIRIGWNAGVWGTGTTAGLRGTWSGRKDSGVDVAASHTPSAYFPVTRAQPPCRRAGPLPALFSHLGQPDPPSNVPSPGSPLARRHHLSIQRSLSTHYLLRTLLGIQSYIVKIHSACSPRASGHFQAKVTFVNQHFASVSPTGLPLFSQPLYGCTKCSRCIINHLNCGTLRPTVISMRAGLESCTSSFSYCLR